jgi:transcriptional regulator with XRE-family HTH domain
MRKTLHSPDYARFLALLTQARKDAGIVQQDLADRLGRPQSFVAKIEGGERRIDIIEFVTIAKAMGQDPVGLLKRYLDQESSARKPRRSAR